MFAYVYIGRVVLVVVAVTPSPFGVMCFIDMFLAQIKENDARALA